VLQHAPALYSLVAHLAPGSIKVREGQQVAQGDVLGLCGNSGRSPTPHVHFQLQNVPSPGGDTLPMSFCDLVMALPIGERLEISHLPQSGDLCRNLEPSDELVAQAAMRPGELWHMSWNGRIETIRSDIALLGHTILRSSEGGHITCTQTRCLEVLHEVVGARRSILSLLRIALPRLPLEDNPSLVWQDYVSAAGLGRRSRLTALGSLLIPRAGLAMSYTMYRRGTSLVVAGVSRRNDKRGASLLRSEITLGPHGEPLSIAVRYGGKEERASRLPNDSSDLDAPLPALGRITPAVPDLIASDVTRSRRLN
jgi:hypothetical protein